MTDRLDRIERLLEATSANQAQFQADMQASRQATQTQFDQFNDRMNATSAILVDLATRQVTTQNQLDQFDDRMNAASATIADLATRQITTQNQIDSIWALAADTRQSVAALLQISVRHEGRLDDLEGQGEVEWLNKPKPS